MTLSAFDLGTILARDPEGFDPKKRLSQRRTSGSALKHPSSLLRSLGTADPAATRSVDFPAGWAEWNDTFRNIVRDFWRGKASPSELAGKLLGSPEQFNHDGRRAWASVNFVTVHDGFTVNDLVSYDGKHNEANLENNNDGSSDNRSWNCGAEGPTDDPQITGLRDRQMRNLLGTLLLSQGSPMLLAGDEFAQTQSGNNNAYCQDNEISWLDWDRAAKNAELTSFVRKLLTLRRKFPVLHSTRFFTGAADREMGVGSVIWLNADGLELAEQNWKDSSMQCFGMLLDTNAKMLKGDAASIADEATNPAHEDASLLIVFNSYFDVVNFTLPVERSGFRWKRVVDSNLPAAEDEPFFASADAYEITGRSFVIFEQFEA